MRPRDKYKISNTESSNYMSVYSIHNSYLLPKVLNYCKLISTKIRAAVRFPSLLFTLLVVLGCIPFRYSINTVLIDAMV